MDSNYSLADIRAATDDGAMNGQGGWFWIVVLFLFMFGFGGNGMGFGRNNNADVVTRAELGAGFDFNNLQNDVRSLHETAAQGFSGLNRQVSDAQFSLEKCCCETNRNIDALRYDGQKNTCEITSAIHAEGEQTRALINANMVQELRDRLEDKDRALMTANFQLSNQAQSAHLIDELRPCAKPAWITCSPYQAKPMCDCGGCYA